jgi:hypothetical protein
MKPPPDGEKFVSLSLTEIYYQTISDLRIKAARSGEPEGAAGRTRFELAGHYIL